MLKAVLSKKDEGSLRTDALLRSDPLINCNLKGNMFCNKSPEKHLVAMQATA